MSQIAHPIELQLDLGQKKSEARSYARNNQNVTLGTFLGIYPARTRESVPEEYYSQPLKNFLIIPVILEPSAGVQLTPPEPAAVNEPQIGKLHQKLDAFHRAANARRIEPEAYPEHLSDNEAVQIAYRHELEAVARYLQNGLSVLIICDKILTEHIYEYICQRAGKIPILDDSPPGSDGARSTNMRDALDGALGQPRRNIEANLPLLLRGLKENQVLILRSVEVLNSPPLIELLYQGVHGDRKPQLLGFLDPSLESDVKPVLVNRFAIRFAGMMGLPRHIQPDPQKPKVYTVSRLITSQERACFEEFDAEGLFKNVAGLNPIQFRNAMRFVGATVAPNSSPQNIYKVIRQFKTSASDEIEIPDTEFRHIGGYERVKQELRRIIALATGRVTGIEERERQKLIPRGFIFHGPPGTGKTLFAKAIANEMNATIQMVSGPEIMDKYLGQSENNLRHIFAVARRNAPSVIFFDEFDSIASQRSTYSDSGSRENNAVVAQLLTELDGFREDQAVMVIGTTNRIDIIDEALLRPSRLRPIEIGLPDPTARRSVATIHSQSFGVDVLLHSLFDLVLQYRESWERQKQIPAAFLQALFATFPPCQDRYETQAQQASFLRELQGLFNLLQTSLHEEGQPEEMDNPILVQVQERVRAIGKTYGVDFDTADSSIPTNSSHQSIETDLLGLFEMLRKEVQQGKRFSSEIFVSGVMDLISEYTEGFNNDEIRAIFQEASLEYHLDGQLITPRYLGMKIGLIRKRRDERQMVHLPGFRRRQ